MRAGQRQGEKGIILNDHDGSIVALSSISIGDREVQGREVQSNLAQPLFGINHIFACEKKKRLG